MTPGAAGIWPVRVEDGEQDPCLSCDAGTRCAARSTMKEIWREEHDCGVSQLTELRVSVMEAKIIATDDDETVLFGWIWGRS